VAESGSTARSSLGAQASDSDLTAIAALAKTNNYLMVANGSAWALESPAQVRASLDLEAGTDIQAYDAGLGQIAALDDANSNFMVGNGTAWVAENGATARTSLGLGSLATASTISNSNWSGTALAVANGGTGSSTAATAATALGVGTASSPQFTAVNVGAATDTTLSRDSAGKLAVEGRPMVTMDNAAYASARIIVTATTPTDTTGMSTGDIKLVY